MAIGLTGNHWNQKIWDDAIENHVLLESKHRLCGLNMKLRNLDAPSNLCLKILSTFEIQRTPCNCGIEFKDHVNDWHPYGYDDDRMTHRDAMLKLYGILFDKGIFKFDSTQDDTEHLYPTDERVEWKRKRKENKEKGIEVKKRTKVVEAHFDDCGTDLSGLNVDKNEIMLYGTLEPDIEPFVAGLCTGWFKGSDGMKLSSIPI